MTFWTLFNSLTISAIHLNTHGDHNFIINASVNHLLVLSVYNRFIFTHLHDV